MHFLQGVSVSGVAGCRCANLYVGFVHSFCLPGQNGRSDEANSTLKIGVLCDRAGLDLWLLAIFLNIVDQCLKYEISN